MNRRTFLQLAVLFASLSLLLSQTITWYNCPIFTDKQIPTNTTQISEPAKLFSQNEKALDDAFDVVQFKNQLRELLSSSPFLAPHTPILTQKQRRAMFGDAAIPQAQCAEIPLPVAPGIAQTINIFVKRISTEAQEGSTKKASKAVWLLQGGPGGAINALEPQLLTMYQQLAGDADIYLLEHRGVGRSTRMNCVGPQAETKGSELGVHVSENEFYQCAKEISTSATAKYMSTTNAAQDLKTLITLTKEDKDVFVYGISYGTFWGSRFMQLDGAQQLVKGVVLDGIVQQAGYDRLVFDKWDSKVNSVGEYFLSNYCAADALCKKKLTDNPVQFTYKLFEKLYVNQTCKSVTDNLPAARLRQIFGAFLKSSDFREFIAPLIFRLNRCDPDVDTGALNTFLNALKGLPFAPTGDCVPMDSPLLQRHVALSEMFEDRYTVEQLEEIFNSTIIGDGWIAALQKISPVWPKYATDDLFNKTFTAEVPVLLINGDLDPQTPQEYAYGQFDNIQDPTGTNKQLVILPYAVHYTVFRSKVNNSELDCGMQLLLQFVKNPTQPLDLSCKDFLVPPNFAGSTKARNVAMFGVEDLYDGVFVPPEQEQTVSLYLFIGIEAGTLVASIVIICSLIYYVVKLKDQVNDARAGYQDVDRENNA